jgi:hypothetical protein
MPNIPKNSWLRWGLVGLGILAILLYRFFREEVTGVVEKIIGVLR